MKTVYLVIGGGYESTESTFGKYNTKCEAKTAKIRFQKEEEYVDYFYIKKTYGKEEN